MVFGGWAELLAPLGFGRVVDMGTNDVDAIVLVSSSFDPPNDKGSKSNDSEGIMTPGSSPLEAPPPSTRTGFGFGNVGTACFGLGSIESRDDAPAPLDLGPPIGRSTFGAGFESSSSSLVFGFGRSTVIRTGPSRRLPDFLGAGRLSPPVDFGTTGTSVCFCSVVGADVGAPASLSESEP